jgi:predicted NUDIX family phosphoesterase
MIKNALVTNKQEVLDISYDELRPGIRIIDKYPLKDPSLLELKFRLADRALCETDLNLLQLLPYITLVDTNTNKVFVYKRGESGNEERLVGLHSIGVGGHIEEAPGPYSNIDDVIAMNIVREINEEVGIDITANFYGRIQWMLNNDRYTIMYAPDEPVGQYHLCFWMILKISIDDFGDHEHNVITEGTWLSVEELQLLSNSNSASLEGWSKHCLVMLKEIQRLESIV